MRQLHGWRDAADAHVGSLVVVTPKPLGGKILYFLKALEEILIEPIVAYRPVVSLDIAVLLRLSWLNVHQADTFPPGPALQPGANVLRAVVAADFLRTALPFGYLFQSPHNTFGGKRKVDLNAKAFPVNSPLKKSFLPNLRLVISAS